MVQIHKHRAVVRRRAPYRRSRLSKNLPHPAEQAIAAVHPLSVPWACTQPARARVPRSTDEKNLLLPTCAIH
eukprot:3783525-Pleurochrysis_carterae.AAC.1